MTADNIKKFSVEDERLKGTLQVKSQYMLDVWILCVLVQADLF